MSDRKSYDPNSHEGMQIRLNNYAEELEYERVTSRAAIATLTAENAELRRERDRAVRVLKVVALAAQFDVTAIAKLLRLRLLAPGDFDWLRQLIESEEGQ